MNVEATDKAVGVFEHGAKAVKAFGYKGVGILATLLVVGGLAMAFWENRPVIYKSISAGPLLDAPIHVPLSEESQQMMKDVVLRQDTIVATEVVQADFRQNTRKGVWFYSDNDALQKQWNEYQQRRVADAPILIQGDTDANDRMIGIMNQDFVCVDTPERIKMILPAAPETVKMVCSISIPPFPGSLIGYVSIWLNKPVTRTELLEYKTIARQLSGQVYKNDVARAVK